MYRISFGCAALVLFGCAGSGPSLAQNDECLVSGTPEAGLLLPAREEANALVAIEFEQQGGRGTCSGVAIDPSLVLTARHCIGLSSDGAFEVIVGSSLECPIARLKAHMLDAHDSLDVALLEVSDLPSISEVAPLHLNDEPIDSSWIGRPVQISGFGADRSLPPNERQFVVETISELSPDSILVDGQRRAGACFGDSGGAMLTRTRTGAPVVLGVLSEGSNSCVGIDRYVRVDQLSGWLPALSGGQPPREPCGGIDATGACFGPTAVRCVGGRLVAQQCLPPEFCGFTRDGRYGCLVAPETSCETLDQLGECLGETARRCEQGQLVEEHCDAIATKCARSPATGAALCQGS